MVADYPQGAETRGRSATGGRRHAGHLRHGQGMDGAGHDGDGLQWPLGKAWQKLTGFPRWSRTTWAPLPKTFIDKDLVDLPDPGQSDLGLENCRLRWVQCEALHGTEACIREITSIMHQTGGRSGTANADITFLTDDVNLGNGVVKEG